MFFIPITMLLDDDEKNREPHSLTENEQVLLDMMKCERDRIVADTNKHKIYYWIDDFRRKYLGYRG